MTGTEAALSERIGRIRGRDPEAFRAAGEKLSRLAAPPGSLGRLGELAVQTAGITGRTENRIRRCRVLVACADNGVVSEGVSIAPESVTLAQAENLTRGVTGMSAMAARFGDEVQVVDFGIRTKPSCGGILDRRIRPGTDSIRTGPAMRREEAVRAVTAGMDLVRDAGTEGIDAVGVGEMGIGNTTTSAAVLSALLGEDPSRTAGRGGGGTDAQLEHKRAVIREALRVNRPDPGDPLDVLSRVGGLDLAAMCGMFLGAAEARIPAVADGLISLTAALCAVRLCPRAAFVIVPSHGSAEAGAALAAEALGLRPYLDLSMRLGEGSGCPLGFRVLEAACALMTGMASFEEAGIDDGYLDPIRGKENGFA